MPAVDDQAAPAAIRPRKSCVPALASDPVSHLSEVYRDYPGLRALILRRVRDPEVAADILQDAAVTTLEKLRRGEIAHPENVGGYLYRVALNHLRNHRRKERTTQSSAIGLNELEGGGDLEWELLMRFYLKDEEKEQICHELRLSREHFNRVIFRARNRFRELLAHRGLWKADLLTVIAIGGLLGAVGHAVIKSLGEIG
jgi:RNA polymerase sigma-70 factor (ECF subfamily)